MTRFAHGTIDPSTTSGTDLAALLSQREAAEDTGHAGTGRPAYAVAGMIYTDDSFTPSHPILAGTAGDGSDDIDLYLLFAPRPGTIRASAEIDLAPGWLWADGAAVSRATNAPLFNAITKSVTGNVANASATISSVSEDLRQKGLIGAKVEGTGITAGTTIAAISASTITLSANATATNTGVALRILPWGAGNGTTTFNVPDVKDRAMIGRGDMGGTDAALITTAVAGFDGTRLAAAGGAQAVVLLVANLPVHSHSASTSGTTDTHGGHVHADTLAVANGGTHNHDYHRVTIGSGSTFLATAGTGTSISFYDSFVATANDGLHNHALTGGVSSGGAHAHVLTLSTSIGNTGGDVGVRIVQPSVVMNFVVKT
jgi:microcystin-dependent protein